MSFKRFLRHSNSSYVFLFLIVIGLVFGLFISSNFILKLLGLLVAFIGLFLFVLVFYDTTSMFWRSHYQWWDDEEFKAWEKGEL